MSDQLPVKNAKDTPEPKGENSELKGETPESKGNVPDPKGAIPSKSKSYYELMIGFEEIRKIQTNQEIFKKRSSIDSSFQKIKKTIDDQETPKS